MTSTEIFIGIGIGYFIGLMTIPAIWDSLRANNNFQIFLDKVLGRN